jgi:SAM-dependent methyltransferase
MSELIPEAVAPYGTGAVGGLGVALASTSNIVRRLRQPTGTHDRWRAALSALLRTRHGRRDTYAADAAVYDHLSAHLNSEDLPFYQQLASETGGPVLEMACGTGRILLPLVAEVGSGAGVDASASMIRRARSKAATLGLAASADLRVGDIRTVDLGKTFPLVVIPYSSLFQLATEADLVAALRNAHCHAERGATVAADVFVPNLANMKARQGLTYLVADVPVGRSDARVLVWEHTSYDGGLRKVVRRRIYEAVNRDGLVLSRRHGILDIYFRQPDEVLDAFTAAGLKVNAVYGDFDRQPLTPGSGRLVVVATA